MKPAKTPFLPDRDDPVFLAALKAVDTIFNNLSTCDFPTDFGHRALNGLREYRLDMAADIAAVFEGLQK
jgi:hypothetical protein